MFSYLRFLLSSSLLANKNSGRNTSLVWNYWLRDVTSLFLCLLQPLKFLFLFGKMIKKKKQKTKESNLHGMFNKKGGTVFNLFIYLGPAVTNKNGVSLVIKRRITVINRCYYGFI